MNASQVIFQQQFPPLVVENGDSDSNNVNNCSNETASSFDVTNYLAMHLGYRHRSPVESAVLTVVYCAILCTGVIGNLVVIRILHFQTESKESRL